MKRSHVQTDTPAVQQKDALRPAEPEGIVLSSELIEAFLNSLLEKGRTPDTVQSYRKNLEQFYNGLTGEKRITPGRLDEWKLEMQKQGLAPRTINMRISVMNSLAEYCGRRELQASTHVLPADSIQPELTRSEYLRLLSTARLLEKQRIYLMIKVFGTLGLSVQELCLLTVQAVGRGQVLLGKQVVRIPLCLQRELTDYIRQENIRSGPVFVTAGGTPLMRSYISASIRALSSEARVPAEKCNPRCLKKLCHTTRDSVRENLELLFEQTYDRLLEREEQSIGWNPPETSLSGHAIPPGRAR